MGGIQFYKQRNSHGCRNRFFSPKIHTSGQCRVGLQETRGIDLGVGERMKDGEKKREEGKRRRE